jgi:Thioesterase-like superfamily
MICGQSEKPVMNITAESMPCSAYAALDGASYRPSSLTRGPWHPDHQHAGPPIALMCRAIENAALKVGLTHLSRLTANLLRPVPIRDLTVEVSTHYVGRNAGHFSARLIADDKEVAHVTALVQRENDVKLPDGLPGHPLPHAPQNPDDSPAATFPFAGKHVGYADLVDTRAAHGLIFKGPCAIWFRLRHPLLENEEPSVYQRVAVAADSGNGISAILDFARYSFVNVDLTINLLRKPVGEWICLDARTCLGPNGCGLAESKLYDVHGLIGMATQGLAIRARD